MLHVISLSRFFDYDKILLDHKKKIKLKLTVIRFISLSDLISFVHMIISVLNLCLATPLQKKIIRQPSSLLTNNRAFPIVKKSLIKVLFVV